MAVGKRMRSSMGDVDEDVDVDAPRARAPTAHVMVFSAYVVLPDPATKRLRQSPKAGKLSVNTTEQTVLVAHEIKRRGNYFRTLVKPRKCIVVGDTIKIWSSMANESVLCRLASIEDKACCLEALQIIGVRVVDVSPSRLTQQVEETEPTQVDENVYSADLAALTAVLSNPRRSSELVASISSYSTSPQLASDIATISRAFFDRP